MIRFSDVSLSYQLPDGRSRTVVEHLDLEIQQGELVYLVGPTGSGKTSLLRALYVDVPVDSGTVHVGRYRTDRLSLADVPHLRRSLGIVFQDFQLLPDRTVYDNVAFVLHVTGKRGSVIRSRTIEVLAQVGLSHKRKRFPHELSGGEQQRVSIARAIANEPRVLLADEPTGNLDPSVADEIMQVIVGLHRQGMTVFMATHNYRLVKKFPSRTFAFLGGNLVEVDPANL